MAFRTVTKLGNGINAPEVVSFMMRCRRSKFGRRGGAPPYLVEILHKSADEVRFIGSSRCVYSWY
jgi:hypothetical protein